MPVETWRPHPSFPAYELSDQGRARSVDRVVETSTGPRKYRGQVLQPGRSASGHMTVCLGRGNTEYLHVAILRAFEGEAPAGHEGCHNDGDPSNNVLSNLRWGTHSSNGLDVAKHGGRKLSPVQVREARMRYKPFCKVNGAAALAREMNVSKAMMSKAITGILYAGIL